MRCLDGLFTAVLLWFFGPVPFGPRNGCPTATNVVVVLVLIIFPQENVSIFELIVNFVIKLWLLIGDSIPRFSYTVGFPLGPN